jgi:hypothetical protein
MQVAVLMVVPQALAAMLLTVAMLVAVLLLPKEEEEEEEAAGCSSAGAGASDGGAAADGVVMAPLLLLLPPPFSRPPELRLCGHAQRRTTSGPRAFLVPPEQVPSGAKSSPMKPTVHARTGGPRGGKASPAERTTSMLILGRSTA